MGKHIFLKSSYLTLKMKILKFFLRKIGVKKILFFLLLLWPMHTVRPSMLVLRDPTFGIIALIVATDVPSSKLINLWVHNALSLANTVMNHTFM
jgi:hypothetical protein